MVRLPDVLLWRLAEAPARIGELIRWVRIQWPRVLPDAVGKVVCDWKNRGFIEVGEDGRWRVRRGGRNERS
jgi:hypothetical protein